MIWVGSHWLVLLFFGLYTVMLVRHAIRGKQRTHGLSDYYIGGRSMGGVALGLSFFATYSSTNSFIGFSGQAYSYGAAWLLLAPAAVVFSLAAWVLVAPRLRRFSAELDSITIPDFIGFRFESSAARFFAALIVIFASLLYMTAVFKGIGNLLEVFLGIPYPVATLGVLVIVMMYTAVGGFISVVRTDVVQGIVMVVAAVLLFTGVVSAAGGIGSLAELKADPETSDLFRWDSAMSFPVLVGIIVAGTMKFMVEPRQLSRFYALEDDRARKQGQWISTIAFLVVYSLLMPIGLYAHRLIADPVSDTDLVVPTLIAGGGFSPIISAFLVVAMVAAAMSSLDSVLLVTASTCERDVVGQWQRSLTEQSALKATRIYVVLFAVITAMIALNPPGQIVDLTALSGSVYAACFFPAIILGLYWKRGTGFGVIASFVVGLGTLVVWRTSPAREVIHEVFPAMAASILAYVASGALHRRGPTPTVARLWPSG